MNISSYRSVGLTRFFAVLTVFSMLLSAFPVQILVAEAGVKFTYDPDVTICHATAAATNPYTNQTVSASSIINLPNGHDDHNDDGLDDKGDIIPSFDYNDGSGTSTYPGKNWSTDYSGATGEEVYNSGGCDGGPLAPPTIDLSITKTADDITPAAGDTVTYTIEVTNNGPDDATDLVVTDDVPAGTTFVSATPAETGSGPYTWDIASLANGASAQIAVVVTVDADTDGDVITNTVSVTATETDTNDTNNSVDEDVTVEIPVVLGCTDNTADNYNPLATDGNADAGDCTYPVPGCMATGALNYDVTATVDDGSCVYPPNEIPGCTDSAADNYDVLATVDDGSCTYPVVLGCTDNTADNYYPLATDGNADAGDCTYPVPGCTDIAADNYDVLATTDDGSCTYPDTTPWCSYAGVAVDWTADEDAKTNGGALVNAARRNVTAVETIAPYANFGGSEGNDWNVSPLDFFTLGIEGFITYEFTDQVAFDQAGDDIAIYEITGGTSGTGEEVDVWVSQNGTDFVFLETVMGDAAVDISSAGLDFVKFVKLVDNSAGVQGTTGDGYDVDGIVILDGSCGNEPDPVPETGTLVVKKVVASGDAVASSFSFQIDGETPIAFEDDAENVFVDMVVGTYTVTEMAATSYTPGYENCAQLEIVADATTTCTITNRYSPAPTYLIFGYVWEDTDEDGEFDEDEEPLEGWSVHATDGEANLDTSSNGSGYYEFNVPAGTWTISETVEEYWSQTFPFVEEERVHIVTVPDQQYTQASDSWTSTIMSYLIPTAHAQVAGQGPFNFGNVNNTLTCSLTANNTLVRTNARVVLTWSTANANTVAIDNGVGSVAGTGTVEVIVAGDTTYTLTATQGNDTVQCPVTIIADSGSGGGGSTVGGGRTLVDDDDDDSGTGTVAGASTSNDPIPQVLGEQISIVPVGAPNAGGGGAAPAQGPVTTATMFGIAVGFLGNRRIAQKV